MSRTAARKVTEAIKAKHERVRKAVQAEQEARRRDPLTRARVIEAALAVMDEEGLEAVTMRRIGRELGVEAMSLYNHVRDKEDILEGVTDAVMSEFEIPVPTGDWAEDMRAMSVEWRRLLGLHPPICQLLAERHKPLEGLAAYRAMDAALGLLRSGGLPAREAAQTFNAFGSYIIGFVTMEQGLMPGGRPIGDFGLDDDHRKVHEEIASALEERGFPNVVECFPYFAECPGDEQFRLGLDLLIAGVKDTIAGRAETA